MVYNLQNQVHSEVNMGRRLLALGQKMTRRRLFSESQTNPVLPIALCSELKYGSRQTGPDSWAPGTSLPMLLFAYSVSQLSAGVVLVLASVDFFPTLKQFFLVNVPTR